MSGEKCRRETDWRYNHSQNGGERWRKHARKARAASGTCAYNEMHGIGLPGSIRNGRYRRRRRLAAIERGDRQLAAIEAGMLPREAKRLP